MYARVTHRLNKKKNLCKFLYGKEEIKEASDEIVKIVCDEV